MCHFFHLKSRGPASYNCFSSTQLCSEVVSLAIFYHYEITLILQDG
jgi:hypothetical protein